MHVCSTIYVLLFLFVENVSSFTITETIPDDFVACLADPATCLHAYIALHTVYLNLSN